MAWHTDNVDNTLKGSISARNGQILFLFHRLTPFNASRRMAIRKKTRILNSIIRDSTVATPCLMELPKSRWIDRNGYRKKLASVIHNPSALVSIAPLTFFDNYTGCQFTVESHSRIALCAKMHCGISSQPISATRYTRICQRVPYDHRTQGLLEVLRSKTETDVRSFSI